MALWEECASCGRLLGDPVVTNFENPFSGTDDGEPSDGETLDSEETAQGDADPELDADPERDADPELDGDEVARLLASVVRDGSVGSRSVEKRPRTEDDDKYMDQDFARAWDLGYEHPSEMF